MLTVYNSGTPDRTLGEIWLGTVMNSYHRRHAWDQIELVHNPVRGTTSDKLTLLLNVGIHPTIKYASIAYLAR